MTLLNLPKASEAELYAYLQQHYNSIELEFRADLDGRLYWTGTISDRIRPDAMGVTTTTYGDTRIEILQRLVFRTLTCKPNFEYLPQRLLKQGILERSQRPWLIRALIGWSIVANWLLG